MMETDLEDESKIPVGNRKCIFWQTSISDQRPKLRVHINGIVIVSLIDMGTNASLLQNLGIQIGPSRGSCSITRNWNHILS